MSSILSRDAEKRRAERTSDPLMRAFEVVLEEAESGRSRSQDGRIVRPFLLVDLGAALGYLRGKRGGTTETVANSVEETLETRMESSDRGRSGRSGGGGRSILSRLFLVGAVVGLAYVLRKRSGSVDELASKATDRARSVADETARRSGEAAGRAETVTDEAADTIRERGEMAAETVQEGSEKAADRVEEGGERAADQIEGAGETVENAEEKAEESVSGGSNSDEGSEGGQ
ncbi:MULTISPECIES: hypothetical protein [Halorussus]|uniref:hypothetical protein n=1 Tax=Halorussus TaxID=1070314 RepID=UPI0020A23025|nr:hypothetical protein [Halorussus vallis]USZ77135.1 hypothetical protein NGM07_07355 [Halorussus vallis]